MPELSQETICTVQNQLSRLNDELKENINLLETESKLTKNIDEYPKVTFLGTGSSSPSKYRCVSGILVEHLPGRYIIMDCGEGTVLQLHRIFGRQKSQEVLVGLSAVYISHLHADHHLGLIGIIKERKRAFEKKGKEIEKLYLLAPSNISIFLCMYHSKFEDVLTDLFQIRNQHLLPFIPPKEEDLVGYREGSPFKRKNPFANAAICLNDEEVITTQKLYPLILSELLKDLGLKSVTTSRALHCPGAFCVSFKFDYGELEEGKEFKLVYTGDTRPNHFLDELALNADLLIHEATLEHYMLDDCLSKKHSTFTEATECAQRVNAKFTILTHFSQRYPKFPPFEEFENEDTIGCAWDTMTVSPQTFRFIKPVYEAIKVRFSDEMSTLKELKDTYEYKSEGPAKRIASHLGLEFDEDAFLAKKRSNPGLIDEPKNKKLLDKEEQKLVLGRMATKVTIDGETGQNCNKQKTTGSIDS